MSADQSTKTVAKVAAKEPTETPQPMTETEQRNAIRGEFFKAKHFKKKIITLQGVDMEIRQPTIGSILEFREEEDRKVALLRMMVVYCFIPGTNIKIFEDADFDAIMSQPFDDSVMRLSEAIEDLTGLDLKATEKN